MSYQTLSIVDAAKPLDVLGDSIRRRILEVVRDRPRPVSEIAERLPVSRPAVSRHLRLLKEAGLVDFRAEGTRRIYRIRPEGFGPVVAYWDQFWADALTVFKTHAESTKENE